MADNIPVPTTDDPNPFNVVTDEVDGRHFPVYKQAFGLQDEEPSHVSDEAPLPQELYVRTIVNGVETYEPLSAGEPLPIQADRIESLLSEILKEHQLHTAIFLNAFSQNKDLL